MSRSVAWINGVWGRLIAAPSLLPRRRVLLCVTALEDRTTPATFIEAGTALDLDLDVFNSRLGIVSAGTSYTLTLTGDTWSGADTANVAGNGTSTLTVTSAGLAALTAVNVTNSNNGVRVTFNDSGANTYSDDFTVSLTGNPNPVSFSGATNFVTSNLTVDTAQAITLAGSGVALTSTTGNLTLRANVGASPTPGDFDGITVATDALVQVTGSGLLTLQGRGGTAGHGDEIGVAVFAGGRVLGGTGAVSVAGTGGVSTGQVNYGVYLDGTASAISSTGGAVTVTGTGSGFGTSASNLGVLVSGGAQLSAGGTGTVTVTGTGSSTVTGNTNYGVRVTGTGSRITSAGGNVSVTGTGGGSGASSDNYGVFASAGAELSAGGTGTITVTGAGGTTTGSFDHGVLITGTGTRVTSGGGSVRVTGTAGSGLGATNLGVALEAGAVLTAGGLGAVTVVGTGGATPVGLNHGVFVLSQITSSGGDITVTGTQGGGAAVGIGFQAGGSVTTAANGGSIALIADAMSLDPGTVAAPAAGAVTLRPLTPGRGIDLGGADGTALGLTDAELDNVTAGALRIGGAGTGAVTFSAPITRNGNVTLTGSAVTGALAGTDLDVGSGTLSFGPGTTLASTVTGAAPDTGYDQISVTGRADLSGVGVALSGSFAPPVGTVFDLVRTTAAVSGSFGPSTTTLNGVVLELSATVTAGTAAVPAPATSGIPPQAAPAGGPPVTLDLNDYFTGPAVPIVYAVVANTDPARGSATVSGSVLTLAGLAAGTTTVTVRLTDANGQFVDGTFTLTVTPAHGPTRIDLFVVGEGDRGGQVRVYNADGSLRFSTTPFVGYTGGVSVATGDVNNDGTADVVVGAATGASHVKVFDGATGAELRSFLTFDGFAGGVSVATADLNRDGVPDLVVGAGRGASGGHLKVFDGATGGLLRSFLTFDGFAGGIDVAAGDLNRDGVADLVVTAKGTSHVKAFDGATGGSLRSFFFGLPGIGASVAAGDVNGDGAVDLIVGSTRAGSQVTVFDGATDVVLRTFTAFPGFESGVRVASRDVNGDGVADVLVGTVAVTAHVKAFSGADLSLLQSFIVSDSPGVFVG